MERVPDILLRRFSHHVIKQIHQFKLFEHDVLKKEYFVLVKMKSSGDSPQEVERVESIWSKMSIVLIILKHLILLPV
ncbi:hypothetical protein PGTUg99_034834 [Puccinia graminis f. sp. tritici]|uniref:Uncharacterized protein n=1 Tax=Puccinia graminis f. sp. tritici TaxID=56615 RepID=A0A5B0SEB1_PUCGR|nr:hypothetical protein PGTUg99_034834 [Puccinia graminis f. sp. tritici]